MTSLIKTVTVLRLTQFRILILGVDKLQKNLEDLTRQVRNLKEHKRDRNVKIKCWNCDKGDQIRKNCAKRQRDEDKKFSWKVFQISIKSSGENKLFVMDHVIKIPCRIIIDKGVSVIIIRTNVPQNLRDNFI